MKIGLGAVQFGCDYGVSNTAGKTPLQEVRKILDVAAANGIEIVDTAAAYGDSEAVIGQALPLDSGFKIVTKLAGALGESLDAEAVEAAFHESLNKLRRQSIYGLLAHRADDVLDRGGDRLLKRMHALKEAGAVRKVGVSVYTAQQIDGLLENCDVDLVQLPISLLDQRLLRSGHLEKLKKKNIEIHARSIFLQGLMLMRPDALPTFFEPVRSHLMFCADALREAGVSPLEAALAFVQGIEEIDVAVCGVNDYRQLEDICTAIRSGRRLDDAARFALADDTYLNPANWRLQ